MNAYLAQSVLQDRYALAQAHERVHRARSRERTAVYDAVTIRRVTPDDWNAVERLARLEAVDVPHRPALLAEVDERVLAVRSLADGTTVADPFQPTAELVELLAARSKALGASTSSLRHPIRAAARLLPGRTG
jgi:hypothetical protein